MTTFVIADTHFGHKKCAEWRGFSDVEAMNETLVGAWNSVVDSRDTVYVLGDFAFGVDNIDVAGRLNGHKHLVAGNHDTYESAKYLKYFNKIHGAKELTGCILTHIPVHPGQLDRYAFNIHGHLHTECIDRTGYVCVSVERLPCYKPIEIKKAVLL